MPRIGWCLIATGLAIAGCPDVDECDPACPGGTRCFHAACVPLRDGGDAIADDSGSDDDGGTTDGPGEDAAPAPDARDDAEADSVPDGDSDG